MYTGQLADAACRASGTNTGNLSITFSAWVRLAAAFRSGVGRLNVRLPWSPWCALALSLTCVGNAAASIDICSQPEAERHVAVAYYDQAESDFEGGTGRTSRVKLGLRIRTSQYDIEGRWDFAADERLFALFLLPRAQDATLRKQGLSDQLRPCPIRLIQRHERRRSILSRLVSIAGRGGLATTAVPTAGGYQVYPLIAFEWQPHPRWAINLGFPAAQLSYKVSTRVSSYLRISPDGNEWHVKDKSLERQSQLIYEAYLLEWAFRWRVLKDMSLTVSVGREFDARYEMTLADNSRIRVSNDPATRLGLALAWFF
jgi:hypothetical protein